MLNSEMNSRKGPGREGEDYHRRMIKKHSLDWWWAVPVNLVFFGLLIVTFSNDWSTFVKALTVILVISGLFAFLDI